MYIVVFITAANKKEARDLVRVLLKEKAVACVNIVDKIDSFFWWKGKIDRASEVLLIAKSKKDQFKRIVRVVKANHSYECPEIIALPIVNGFASYLKWIDESIRKPH